MSDSHLCHVTKIKKLHNILSRLLRKIEQNTTGDFQIICLSIDYEYACVGVHPVFCEHPQIFSGIFIC